MARGDKQRVTDQSLQLSKTAQGDIATEKARTGQVFGQEQALRGSMLPQYEEMAAHPGYTPQQQAAMGTAAQEGVGGAFGSAQEQLARRAARTRNVAGVGEMADVLARQKAKTMGETGAGLQEKFADTAMKQRQAALEGMGQLYGIDQQTLRTMMGIPAEDVRAGGAALDPAARMAAIPGFWKTMGSSFAQGLGSGMGAGITGGGG